MQLQPFIHKFPVDVAGNSVSAEINGYVMMKSLKYF